MRSYRLLRLIDWFVPAVLAGQPEKLQQARTFLISQCSGPVLGGLVMAYLHGVDPAPGTPFWSSVALLAGFYTYPVLLRLTGALRTLSVASALHMITLVLFTAYHYGGASSPVLPWLVVVPLNSLFYVGADLRHRAVVMGCLALAIAGFYAAYRLGGGFPSHVPVEALAGVGILSLATSLAFVSLMALFYATVVRRQADRLRQEIADRRAAEIRLRESEAHFRLIADNATDMISRVRVSDGARLYVSPASRGLLGYEPQELTGTAAVALAHPDDRTQFRTALKRLRGGEARCTLTFRSQRKDGSWVWLESSVRLVDPTGDGSAMEVLGVARDVTARRKIEEQLVTARLNAEQASRAKSAFLANMSHELRTPLNAIIGFSQVIRGQVLGPLGNDKYLEYASDIADSGQHLLAVINDILDLSKAEEGKLELVEEPLELEPVLEFCLKVAAPRAGEAGVTLELAALPDLPVLRADERMLRQILLNLLSNAVKFTPSGGAVQLTAALDDGGAVVLTVADTGIGIAPEDMDRVMSPFGQVDSSLARKYDGSGLGLPLTKTLVELHGGTLTLDSTPDHGTTVTVRFPPGRSLAARERPPVALAS